MFCQMSYNVGRNGYVGLDKYTSRDIKHTVISYKVFTDISMVTLYY